MFSLIEEAWIPVRRRDGRRERVAPREITADAGNPVLDIDAPRPDFRGALYQFLVGLLQSAHAPADEREWRKGFKAPPDPDALRQSLGEVAPWFDLAHPKTPFMQEAGIAGTGGAEPEPVHDLLIEAPGAKTIKDNTDFFTKRVHESYFCGSCAASAIYTLQVNSPAGGRGTMTSLRGGGPLTTLIRGRTLWETLWLAVLPRDLWLDADDAERDITQRFPWAGPAPKNRARNLVQIHPDQHYWAMPRRLLLGPASPGTCTLCRQSTEHGYSSVRSLAGGFQYIPPFKHPLTPTRKAKDGVLTAKGQPSPAAYRNYVGLVESRSDETATPALVVKLFRRDRQRLLPPGTAPLWGFGYAVDNAKVEGWYEGTMPIPAVEPPHAAAFAQHAEMLVEAAAFAASLLRGAIKDVRLGEARGDLQFFLDPFWATTEGLFYENLDRANAALQAGSSTEGLREAWRLVLEHEALHQFELTTRQRSIGDGRPERLVAARKKLKMNLRGKKMRERTLYLPVKIEEARA